MARKQGSGRRDGLDGIVVVDKPAGMTSHDVVDEVRRRLGTRRVGHAGTLDPGATGVLILGVGAATRLLRYAQASPKVYRAVAVFGTATSTQDASGEVTRRRDASHLGAGDVEAALPALTGDLLQVPPMVSALKLGGERLYAKARRGEEVERAPRPVTVHELSLLEFSPGSPPSARLEVRCSPGTYVRTLVHDLGARLGCGAHLASLRRTFNGGYSEAEAVGLDDVGRAALRPLVDAVRVLPRAELGAREAEAVGYGRPVPAGDAAAPVPEGGAVAVLHSGRLVAVCRRERDRLLPERVLP